MGFGQATGVFRKGVRHSMGYYINLPADGFEAVLNYKKYIDKSD